MPEAPHANPPKKCDLCGVIFDSKFVDGRTVYGPWANMCMSCFKTQGVGLGVGRGQQYQKDPDGKFFKIAG